MIDFVTIILICLKPSIVNASSHVKYAFSSNQQRKTQSTLTLIHLHPNKYS